MMFKKIYKWCFFCVVKRNKFFEKLVFKRPKKACIVIGGIKIHLNP